MFYTEQLSLTMLVVACLGAAVLWGFNRGRVGSIGPYVVVGLLIWVCVLKSGVHATLAGVVAALAIPLSDGKGGSPLRTAEHALHPWFAIVVLPLFAFVNAGVSLQGVSLQTLLLPVPVGIALGLLLGKVTGVFGAAWLLMRFGGASVPQGATLLQFFAVCVLCGIGFTMSLFIGGLAFEGLGAELETQLKLGVLCGSLLSSLLGVGLLLVAPRPVQAQ